MTDDNQIYDIEDSLGYVINRTAIYLKIALMREFKSNNIDITPEQWCVLLKLREEDGQYQKQLADRLLKDKPNITRILDILEKRELVKRKNDEHDRRIYKVFLTNKGKDTTEKLIPIANALKNKIHNVLTKDELKTIKTLLDKIYNELN